MSANKQKKYMWAAFVAMLITMASAGTVHYYTYSRGYAPAGIKCGKVAEVTHEGARFADEEDWREMVTNNPAIREATYNILKMSKDAGMPVCVMTVRVIE